MHDWTVVWDFGDGSGTVTQTPSDNGPPSHSYQSAGTYNVTIAASDGSAYDTRTAFVTVGQAGNPPTAPVYVSANATSPTEVLINWSSSTGATSYLISRTSGDGGTAVGFGPVTGTSFTDTTAEQNKTYCYTVQARDACDRNSAASMPVCATTPIGTQAAVSRPHPHRFHQVNCNTTGFC